MYLWDSKGNLELIEADETAYIQVGPFEIEDCNCLNKRGLTKKKKKRFE